MKMLKAFLNDMFFDREWTAITDQLLIIFLGVLVIVHGDSGFTEFVGGVACIGAGLYLLNLGLNRWDNLQDEKS